MTTGAGYSVVIPTVGRASLAVLLDSIAASAVATGLPLPAGVLVADRREPAADLVIARRAAWPITVLRSGGRGPAAARNTGWRACDSEWVAFLDDDVLVSPRWLRDLERDLAAAAGTVGGSQGRIEVPLPVYRRPTDLERGTATLVDAAWITADLAYRRVALLDCAGFDERFPRAFREDSDLALRMLDRGWQLVRGSRRTVHPVRPAGWWASVGRQRGNADDVLMRRRHGRNWRQRAAAPLGRRPQHLLSTAAGLAALAAAVTGRRRLAALTGACWAANTAEFSWRRIGPGPRDGAEVLRMISTSVLLPPAASWFWLRAVLSRTPDRPAARPAAVLLDRDGTLVRDVAYNGDPALVSPMPGARRALDRLRAEGIPIAVISNQSGIGRGLLSTDQVAAVNARIESLLGPFDGWFVCPHTGEAGCDCRKPA
ncbi:MAG: hypothetical protein QOE23_104, partial [Pseudonocardiales bacterium]|nr:hypothetical protein [Pseudonocardiales bacterium]